MKRKVGCLISVLVLSLASAASLAAAPTLMTDIQYWFAADQIQTMLAFTEPVHPISHYRTNPHRFVLEIANCADIRDDHVIPVDDSVLQQIRVQRLTNGTTQVVFDLKEKIEATIQMLPQANGNPDRVIVSLLNPVRKDDAPIQPAAKAPVTAQVRQPEPQYIVVLDPGHGGQDSGAPGPNGLQEKDVVLDIARTMQTMIEENNSNIKVYLTRTDDSFLSLPQRTAIAEKRRANLFISLHANANPSSKARGFSIYTLSENATDAAARELAEKENAADLVGGVEPSAYQNDALLAFVLADLSQTSWLQHSLEFGQMGINTVIANLGKYKIVKEGLKRANFVVLRTASMPAVLVEACYISNPREEALLSNQTFRTNIAQALAKSTIDYFARRRDSKTQLAQVKETSPTLFLARAADAPPLPQLPYKVHVVRSGESLSLIADKYHVELEQLRQVNQIAAADTIYAGQRLWIP